jgi:hypothetical protein
VSVTKRNNLRPVTSAQLEFFVSQTPELTSMADRIIDLESMATDPAEEAA